MHACRACGKTVETVAQFCPWCFALPGDTRVRTEPTPVPSEPPQAPSTTWGGASVSASRWPSVLALVGIVAILAALVVGLW
jgi:hypothetical protein